MTNVQNELRYAIAWTILKKLLLDGLITQEEYDAAHRIVAEQYCPLAVCR
jgi:hypothetical protein